MRIIELTRGMDCCGMTLACRRKGVIKGDSVNNDLEHGDCSGSIFCAGGIVEVGGSARGPLGSATLAMGLSGGIEVRDRRSRDFGRLGIAGAVIPAVGSDCADGRHGGSFAYTPGAS
jgi:hypothetical protein